MSSEPRAFLVLDLGTATTAIGLIGLVEGRWRLIGSDAAPASIPHDAIIGRLVTRLVSGDAALMARIGVDGISAALDLPRLAARSRPAPRLAVLAGGERGLDQLVPLAVRSGWRVVGRSAEHADALALARLVLDETAEAVLVGGDDPPGADERQGLAELAGLMAAALERRPTLRIVLAGGAAAHAAAFEAAAGGSLVVAPAARAGAPPGEPLRALLERLHALRDDARLASARAVATLAEVLDRRIELLEVGHEAGLRVLASPADGAGDSADGTFEAATVANAALVPLDEDEELVDRVLAWSTTPLDRYRLGDRLKELRIAPWADAAGEWAVLRLAAARAALARLLEATPAMSGAPPPDLVLAAGGVWSVAPGPAVTLALADVVRRPGASQFAYDHARLLGPLGTIEEVGDRWRILRDLADDLLVPLGSVVTPQGVRPGRDVGRAVVHGGPETRDLVLSGGEIQLVDLPPGALASLELRFRDPVRLGARGRQFVIEVGGGLSGLLVDLRDVPLRLPDRLERRREALGAWQRVLWPGLE